MITGLWTLPQPCSIILGMESVCIIEGCENPIRVKSRGLCNKHYRRWQRHGDPSTEVRSYYTNPEEDWRDNTEWLGDCLIWLGTVSGKYGAIRYKGKSIGVHRYAWIREYGDLSDGLHVDHHTCYNKLCVNHQHLVATTNQKNSWNKSGLNTNNTSGYRNVVWDKEKKKWIVQVKTNGKNYHFGRYDTIEEAAKVAEKAREELFGEFAGRG